MGEGGGSPPSTFFLRLIYPLLPCAKQKNSELVNFPSALNQNYASFIAALLVIIFACYPPLFFFFHFHHVFMNALLLINGYGLKFCPYAKTHTILTPHLQELMLPLPTTPLSNAFPTPIVRMNHYPYLMFTSNLLSIVEYMQCFADHFLLYWFLRKIMYWVSV